MQVTVSLTLEMDVSAGIYGLKEQVVEAGRRLMSQAQQAGVAEYERQAWACPQCQRAMLKGARAYAPAAMDAAAAAPAASD